MNILLINHYAGSRLHGMEFRPFYFAREWVKTGHQVQIVAASYSHIRANQPHVELTPLNEIIDGVYYRWYSTPFYHGNGLGRVKNMLSFIWQLWKDAKRFAVEFKPDIVIASSTYPMDIWPANRIAKIAKAKLVFEVHDLWPLSPREFGGMSKWHPFIIWVQLAEDYAYKHADKIISILPKAFSYMQTRGLDAMKFVHVPNGVDQSEWDNLIPLDTDLQNKLNILHSQNLPIVGYAGTHGLANSLDSFLDAAKLLQGKANFILLGKGPEKSRLKKRVESENLTNVYMEKSIDKNKIPSFLAQLDIAYIGLLPESLFRFGISPNKLMDYMMSSIPIVMAIDAGNDPVADAGCGITIPSNKPLAIADALNKILALSKVERIKMGALGKAYVLKHHTYDILAQKFLSAIFAKK